MPRISRSRPWGITILVADDEPAILHATTRFLKACGYSVITAENGELALKAFAEAPHTIQLVVSDVAMPGLRGPQLVRSVRGMSPSTATLLMSGTWTTTPEDGVPLILKPFTRQTFLASVRNLLDSCDFAKIEMEQSVVKAQRLPAITGAGASQPLTTE